MNKLRALLEQKETRSKRKAAEAGVGPVESEEPAGATILPEAIVNENCFPLKHSDPQGGAFPQQFSPAAYVDTGIRYADFGINEFSG